MVSALFGGRRVPREGLVEDPVMKLPSMFIWQTLSWPLGLENP